MNRKRTVQFFPSAQKELRDAVDYYNDQCAGLGFEFAAEVRRTITRIVDENSQNAPFCERG